MTRNQPQGSQDGWRWERVLPEEAGEWNRRLQSSSAHLYQYPLWNEPLRDVRVEPTYACAIDAEGEVRGFAALLAPSVPVLKCGVIRCGPASLSDDDPLPGPALAALAEFARQEGFLCLRVSTTDPRVEQAMAQVAAIDHHDPIPILAHYDHQLVVPLQEAEEDQMSALSSGLRRKIRRGSEEAFVFRRADEPELLEELWSLVEGLEERKGRKVYHRPVSSYVQLARLAYQYGLGDVFYVSLGETPVKLILVVRDRDTAHYVVGAMDLDAVGDLASPGAWAHWNAIRASRAAGTRGYSLGNEGGRGLKRFKMEFNPEKVECLPPFTAVLDPLRYRIWKRFFPLAIRVRRYVSS